MKKLDDCARPHRIRLHGERGVALVLALLALAPGRARAGATPLGQSEVSLALYASTDGSSWSALGASALRGYFGAHRCACPATLLVQLQLTSAGQTNLGSSTLSANFLVGANCQTTPAACVSVGQVSFSASQTVASPTFSSNLVFQTVAGSTTVACTSLTAGKTTLWAILAQDGNPLSFALTLDLPVITATVPAPTAVTAEPASQGLLVSWTPPADTSLVAAYQVLCLPRPATPATAGYETCGLTTTTGATSLTTADTTELCSAVVPAGTTSARLTGLANGTTYTVAVVAIDPSGATSALSPPAQATPQPTLGFYEKYKQDGGAATGCSLGPGAPARGPRLFWVALVVAALLRPRGRRRRIARRPSTAGARILVLLLAASGTAQAQIARSHDSDDWAAEPSAARAFSPPDFSLEVGLSLYRPAIDSELGNGTHPYADTFGNSRRLMTEVELTRYLVHGFGAFGVGLRAGYFKVTASAFLADGNTRSGDETGLRLIPIAVSLVERATSVPGLRQVPLVPYGKVGLDSVLWTASNSGSSGSQSGLSLGWHVAAGLMLGLGRLGGAAPQPGTLAGPGALFFEWDYAAINGLGLGHALHVGDSTWFAGIMFDL